MPITAEAFIRIDESQAVDALGRINTAIRQFGSTAELAGRKALVGLSGFSAPLQNLRLERPAGQVRMLENQMEHLRQQSAKVAAQLVSDSNAITKKFGTGMGEQRFKALEQAVNAAAAAEKKLANQRTALRAKMTAGSYTDAIVPTGEDRATLTSFDNLDATEKSLLDTTERARLSISGLGAELLRMGERGTVSAQGVQQLVTRLELLKSQSLSGTPDFAAVNPESAEAELQALDQLGDSLVHLQDDLKRAQHEVRGTEQELSGMPKQTVEAGRALMHMSSASQGLLLGTSLLQGNLTSAAFAFVFMRFAIISTLVKVAALTVALLGTIKALAVFVKFLKSAATEVREFGKEAQRMSSFLRSALEAHEIETFADRFSRAFGVSRELTRELGFELKKFDRDLAKLGQETNFFESMQQGFIDAAAALGIDPVAIASAFRELFTTIYEDADEAEEAFKDFSKEFDVNINSAMDSLEAFTAVTDRFGGSGAAAAEQLDGKMVRLGETFRTVRIQIGKLLETGLKPFLDIARVLGEGIIEGFEGAKQAADTSGKLTEQIAEFKTTVERLIPILGSFGVLIGRILFYVMGKLASATKAVIDGFLWLWNITKGLRNGLVVVGQALKSLNGKLVLVLAAFAALKALGSIIKLPKLHFASLKSTDLPNLSKLKWAKAKLPAGIPLLFQKITSARLPDLSKITWPKIKRPTVGYAWPSSPDFPDLSKVFWTESKLPRLRFPTLTPDDVIGPGGLPDLSGTTWSADKMPKLPVIHWDFIPRIRRLTKLDFANKLVPEGGMPKLPLLEWPEIPKPKLLAFNLTPEELPKLPVLEWPQPTFPKLIEVASEDLNFTGVAAASDDAIRPGLSAGIRRALSKVLLGAGAVGLALITKRGWGRIFSGTAKTSANAVSPGLFAGIRSAMNITFTGKHGVLSKIAKLGWTGILKAGLKGVKAVTLAGLLGLLLETVARVAIPPIAEKMGIDLTDGIAGGIWGSAFSIEAAIGGTLGAMVGVVGGPPGVAIGFLVGTAIGTAIAANSEWIQDNLLIPFKNFLTWIHEHFTPLIVVSMKIFAAIIWMAMKRAGQTIADIAVLFVSVGKVIGDVVVGAWNLMKRFGEWIGNTFGPIITWAAEKFGKSFEVATESAKLTMNALIDAYNWAARKIPGLEEASRIGELDVSGAPTDDTETFKDKFGSQLSDLISAVGVGDALQDELVNALSALIHGQRTPDQEAAAHLGDDDELIDSTQGFAEAAGAARRELESLNAELETHRKKKVTAETVAAVGDIKAEIAKVTGEVASVMADIMPDATNGSPSLAPIPLPVTSPTITNHFDLRGSVIATEAGMDILADKVSARIGITLSPQLPIMAGV